jgi:hypothetical protein
MSRSLRPLAALALCGAALLGRPAAAQPLTADDRCAGLARQHFDQAEVVSAVDQAAGALIPGATMPTMGSAAAGRPMSGLPGFCRVIGRIRGEPGSDIGFELWMPSAGWDGRLNGSGNGGYAGSIGYMELAGAVKAHQVGVSTDTGHRGTSEDAAWAKGHPERVRDFGWRAIHLAALAAKALVAGYYGRGPDHAYFIGASNGGRQGLMEASRYPDDYDGVMAGAPATVRTDELMTHIWVYQAQMPPGAAIRPEQLRLLQSEVVRQCDAIDGQVDGLVADPRRCRFDVSRLACGAAAAPLCFTPPQLAALRRIYAGPQDRAGRRIAVGLPPSGAEVGDPAPMFGWDAAICADPNKPSTSEFLSNFIAAPFADNRSFDFDRDPPRLKAALSAELDVQPDLRRFFARGGKLIIWQGWADASVPPQATLNFYEAIVRNSAGRARSGARLFMVPGVQHGLGGTGPDVFGQLTAPAPGDTPDRNIVAALQAWVETGRSPDALVARSHKSGGRFGPPTGRPEKSRLICAYPARSELRPGADPDSASSYVCRDDKGKPS